MRMRVFWLLFIVSVILYGGIAFYQDTPGYMDADYYYMGGVQLAEGKGFTEPVIWNYLNNPQSIPQPSHQYWMPMASIITAGGMAIFSSTSFWAGKALLILLAGIIPPMVALLALKLTSEPAIARLSGALAIASGYYAIYIPVTETFGLYMLFGVLFFLLLVQLDNEFSSPAWFGLGLVSGCMALTRADGAGFIIIGFIYLLVKHLQSNREPTQKHKGFWLAWILFLVGVSLPVSAWMVRNWFAIGQVFPGGASKTLWLTSYNQLFSYPTDALTFQTWLSSGWSILIVRLVALGKNILTVLVAQGGIVLLPLIIAGFWKLRKVRVVQFAVLVYGGLLLGLTLMFPFASERGGFFHSGASLQPMLWVMAAVGVQPVSDWVATKGIGFLSGKRIAILALSVMVISTLYLTTTRLFGLSENEKGWDAHSQHYAEVEAYILNQGASPRARVAVSNPPSYWAVNRREGIVIPDGDLTALLDVAQKFDVSYLVLEQGHTTHLDSLYTNRIADGFTLLGEIGTTQIYLIGNIP